MNLNNREILGTVDIVVDAWDEEHEHESDTKFFTAIVVLPTNHRNPEAEQETTVLLALPRHSAYEMQGHMQMRKGINLHLRNHNGRATVLKVDWSKLSKDKEKWLTWTAFATIKRKHVPE